MEKEMTREYFVSAGEANPEGELSVSVITNKIIEIATAHANSLHIGNPDMTLTGGGWVLGRLTIEMTSWPAINTNYTITTWIEGWNRHFSYRCFEVRDAGGKTLGYARTVWMIINLKSHENIGLAHFSLPAEMISDRKCPIPLQKKHALSPRADTIPHTFSYTDIDFYRHVNTVRWIEILLNRFPLSHFDENSLSRMEISFMREGRYGDKVMIHSLKRDDDVFEFGISRDDTPLIYSRFTFSPR